MHLENAITILEILSSLSEVIPVLGTPLKGVSEALSKILQHVQELKTHKDKSFELAQKATRWCHTISTVLRDAHADQMPVEHLREPLEDVRIALRDIAITTERWKGQSYMERIWKKGKDAEELAALREQLNDAFEKFILASNIRTHIDLANIQGDVQVVRSDGDRDVLRALHSVMSARYDSIGSPTGCLKGTRTTVLEEGLTWAGVLSDHCCIYWLAGLAGTGKSSVAKSSSELMDRSGRYLVITFFVSKNSAERRNPFHILHTLVLQLANDYALFRQKLIMSMRGYQGIEHRPLNEQIDRLLRSPLEQTMRELHPKVLLRPPVFVIDALDECLNIDEVQGSSLIIELAKALGDLPVKIFVTSRMDKNLEEVFDKLANTTTFKLHEIETMKIAADVRLILRTGLSEIAAAHSIAEDVLPDPKDIDVLVNKTGHLIIFASTALKYIGDRRISQPEDRLRHVVGHQHQTAGRSSPYAELDLIYRDILRSAITDSQGKQDLTLSQRLHQFLGLVMLAEEPLTTISISQLLGLREREVYADLDAMRAVMTLTNDQLSVVPTVRIFHPSFREFLLERCGDTDFRIDTAFHHAVVTSQCVRLLSQNYRSTMGVPGIASAQLPLHELSHPLDIPETIPGDALRYAGIFWLKHLSLSSTHDYRSTETVLEFVLNFTLDWLQLISRLESLSQAARLIPAVLDWCKNDDLDVNSDAMYQVCILLSDALRVMETYHVALAVDSMHIYHSALLTLPECPLFEACQEYYTGMNSMPRLISRRPSKWPAVRLTMEGHSGNVMSTAFSHDGTKVISASTDTSIRIWDAHIGREVGSLSGHLNVVWCVAFSPDDSTIISGSGDSTARLWDAHLYVEIRILRGHCGSVNSAAFRGDGAEIVTGSDDKSIRVWESSTGRQLFMFEGHSGPVKSVAFSNDGQRVVSGSDDHSIRLWSCRKHEEITILRGHTDSVQSVLFTPDDEIIVSCSSDITVRIWDVASARIIDTLYGHHASVWTVAVSANGSLLLSGSSDSTVRLWDLTTADHAELLVLEGHDDWVRCAAFAPHQPITVVSSSDDSTVRVWDVDYLFANKLSNSASKRKNARLRHVTFSPDATRIASTSADNTIQLWDALDGLEIRNPTLEGHCASALSAVGFSTNSTKLASVSSNDLTIWIWSSQDGALTNVIEGHDNWISCYAFSPHGDLMISGSCDSTIRMWEIENGLQVAQFEEHSESVTSVSFSPDGMYFVSSSEDKTIWLWDVDAGSGRQVLNMDDLLSDLTAVQFSHSGSHVITTCDAETIAWIVPGLAGTSPTTPSHMDEMFLQSPKMGISWDFGTGWLSWQDPGHDIAVRLSWIPPELRSEEYATAGTVVALARVIEGALTIIDFEDLLSSLLELGA